jgi:hypothetical protein
MTDPVAAVAEADATGEAAAIFADIRAVYRVGVVNLVWRHLATLPGALPLVWNLVRPAYVDGSVAREATALRARLVLPDLPALPDHVFAAAGLSMSDVSAIRDVLSAYDRTNAMALLALTAARRHLAGVPPPPALAPAPSPAETPAVALPALPSLSDLAPDVATLVLALNQLGANRAQPMLASMYRHLAYWPPVLALSWTVLAPIRDLAKVTESTMATAQHQAGRLHLVGPIPSSAQANEIDAAIARFTDDPILRMTTICTILARTMGAAA